MPETTASRPRASTKPAAGDKGKPPPLASLLSWVLPAIVLAGAWAYQLHGAKEATPEIRYSDLYALLDSGKVDSVTLTGLQIEGKLKAAEKVDGHSITTFRSLLPSIEDRGLLPLLREKGAAITVKSEEQPPLVRIARFGSAVGTHPRRVGLDVPPRSRRHGQRTDGPHARRAIVPRSTLRST